MPAPAAPSLTATPAEIGPTSMADRFVGFAFAAADLLVETDLDGMIGFATGAFRSRLGSNPAYYYGRPITSLFVPDDAQVLDMAMAAARLRGRIAPLLLRLADANASLTSVAALLMPQNGPDSRPCLYFSIGPVASAMVNTGLPGGFPGGFRDKTTFIHLAEDALRAGQVGGLGLLEMPNWKPVARLMSTDDRRSLQESIRRTLEEAAPGAAAGELSEGRFGVLSQASMDMDEIVARLDTMLRRDGRGIGVDGVRGTALRLEPDVLPPVQAARALRYALGRFAEGHQTMGDALGGSLCLANIVAQAQARASHLRRTLADRRFQLLYQPIVSLADRSVHHFEALIRPPPSPDEPVQSIGEFVTFAELVGLSEELDWAVLQTALIALREAPAASVAVNMSGLSMQSPDYRARLITHLQEIGGTLGPLGSERLLIELTETAEIDDLEGAAAAMTELRAIGVPVCLDDFGAGAAAFRYLRAFAVDYVKIDGAYVRAATSQTRDRAMVVSMVEIAASVGAKIVAETVETEEQAALMRQMGVQFGQGWLFGRPGLLPGRRST